MPTSYFLTDNIFSWNFIIIFIFITLVIWAVLRNMFWVNDMKNIAIITAVGLLLYPFIVSATQVFSSLAIMLLITALIAQNLFRVRLTTGIGIAIVVFLVWFFVFPNIV